MENDSFVSYSFTSLPSLMKVLKGTPKARYYFKRHMERWERFFKKPYPKLIAQIGRFDGVQIVESLPDGESPE